MIHSCSFFFKRFRVKCDKLFEWVFTINYLQIEYIKLSYSSSLNCKTWTLTKREIRQFLISTERKTLNPRICENTLRNLENPKDMELNRWLRPKPSVQQFQRLRLSAIYRGCGGSNSQNAVFMVNNYSLLFVWAFNRKLARNSARLKHLVCTILEFHLFEIIKSI